jgi:hypothetical protein
MKVVRLAVGTHWTVTALCDNDGSCPLLDFLESLNDAKKQAKILSDLQQFVPFHTKQDWGSEFSWSLRGSDKIYEFKWPNKKGGTSRVLWFYDTGKIVVCCHAVLKKGDMDEAEIRKAERTEQAYRAAKEQGRLAIVDIDDFDDDEGDTEES